MWSIVRCWGRRDRLQTPEIKPERREAVLRHEEMQDTAGIGCREGGRAVLGTSEMAEGNGQEVGALKLHFVEYAVVLARVFVCTRFANKEFECSPSHRRRS